MIYSTLCFGRKHWNWKEEWLFTYTFFYTFLLRFMVDLSLCRYSSLGYERDIWEPFLGTREISLCSSASHESKVLWPLFPSVCSVTILCLWHGELQCSWSDPVSNTEMLGNRIVFIIISVGNYMQVLLPCFLLMHLIYPVWSNHSLQHRHDALLTVSIS